MTAALVVAALLIAVLANLWVTERRTRRAARRELASLLSLDHPVGDAEVRRAVSNAAAERDRRSEAERVLAAALLEFGDGVIVVDRDGREVLRNRLAVEIADGRHGLALVRGVVDRMRTAALAGAHGSDTVRILGPPPRTLEVTGVPLESDGTPLGAAVLIGDVSNDEMIGRVRRDFVANLSHELKTPVAAIGLLAEALEGEPDDAVRDRLLSRISAESERVASIIDDLLDLSRLEFERTPRADNASLRGVLSEAADRVAQQASAREITVAVQAGDDVVAQCDRDLMVHAVSNLLDNAIKYSDTGSTVEVSVSEDDGGHAEIRVRDTGIGIPATDVERIFERFYRVDQARSRATGGTGLGLSIVRHVAANHGGEVRVVSREGVGSTFVISIPMESAHVS